MRTYLEFIEDLYTDGDEIKHGNIDKFYGEFTETLIQENVVDKSILNEDRTTSLVNMMTIGLLGKLKQISDKVKQEKDTNLKLDLLTDLIKLCGYGGLIGGFVGNKNTKILSKIRRLK
mgnify:CR=1 FL=1|jgi:hypothetical protein